MNTVSAQQNTEQLLIAALNELSPVYISLDNESANHAGYYLGKASHFKLIIVSSDFAGKSRVTRHQMIYRCVQSLLSAGGGYIHALAIHAYTPEQWNDMDHSVPNSPQCAGKRII